jgi:hypothetical protein
MFLLNLIELTIGFTKMLARADLKKLKRSESPKSSESKPRKNEAKL